MEQLRRAFKTIGIALGQLTATQKLLIGSLVIIALMALFVVSQYAGTRRWVELLPGAAPADQQKSVAFLETANIAYTQQAGKVMVRPEDRRTAIAALGEAGKLPSDTSLLFQNILEKQSWQMSRQQNEQLYTIALQNELSRVISDFKGIDSATVILDIPEPAGLGSVVRKPTASATIFTDAGRPLEQGTVDAIAQLLVGARAGLEIERVRVIDGSNGRQRRATSESDVLATTYLEHATRIEQLTAEKLRELLGSIPGAIVAVTAQVDVTRVRSTVSKNLPLSEGSLSLPRRESTSKQTETQGQAAEPGVRSNQTMDINRGSGGGQRLEESQEETEFENHVGSRIEEISDPRGMPTMLAASVAIPRGYIVALLKSAKPAADAAGGAAAGPANAVAEPTEPEVDAAFAREKTRIEDLLKPHVKTRGVDGAQTEGIVSVSMMPTDMPEGAARAGFLGGLGGGSASADATGFLTTAMSGSIIDKVVLGALAVIALGLMLSMVKKAAKRVELPTAEELVGLPPQLESKSDLIGEAGESDSAMTGIEVGDDEVKIQKMLEQVKDYVGTSPDSAARIVNGWLTPEN